MLFDPSKAIAAMLMIFAVLAVGGSMLPDLHTQINSVNTTGWLPIVSATHSLTPFVWIGALLWAVIVIWFAFTHKGGGE